MKMIRFLLPAVFSLMAGCTYLIPAVEKHPLPQIVPPVITAATPPANSYQTQMAAADDHLEKGEFSKAQKILEEVIALPPQSGVTDGALFRLALLNLRSTSRDSSARAQQLLLKLAKDYPHSSWSQFGQYINEIIDTLADQRRQITTLKNQNQSFSKENKELHQTIDLLKNLDLELEKKSRR